MYERVIEHVREQPWAILPDRLATIVDLLRFRAGGQRPTREEVDARIAGRRQDRETLRAFSVDEQAYVAVGPYLGAAPAGGPAQSQVVAVIGVYGVISHRMGAFDEVSGGTSVQLLRSHFRAALDDARVRAIVLDVDSPGGTVSGVQELAAEILAGRERKPIAAVANTLAASAAYWLMSAAGEAVVTPSGEVGSIGVYGAHEDLSAALEKEGVKVTLISAGKYKTEGNPFEPLSDEGRAAIQARVDDYYDAFVKAVSKGRGVSPSKVQRGFGEGRVVGAQDALAEGMVDRVDTLDETVRRMAGRRGAGAAAPRAEQLHPEVAAAQARLRLLQARLLR